MKKNKDLLDMYKTMKTRKSPQHATKVVPQKKKDNKRLKVIVQFDSSFSDITGEGSGE